mgnify:CR=1 FL=1
MRHPVLRYGAAALCVLGAVYFLLPLSMGVLHIGMLYPAAGLLLAAVWLVFPGLSGGYPGGCGTRCAWCWWRCCWRWGLS